MALDKAKAMKKPAQPGKWSAGQGPPQAKAPKNTGRERPIGRADYRQLCQSSRLPPGSSKSLTWDGQTWFVTMTIPGYDRPFEGEGPSELAALYLTHSKYQATAARAAKGLDI
jgi:hypothetical protein